MIEENIYETNFELWWQMADNKTIDSSTYEGFMMDSYIRKNQIKPTFIKKI